MYSSFTTSLELFDFGSERVLDANLELEPPLYGVKSMDSVYGDYEDESNGPFLSKKDPLLSSSASNLFALSVEAGTVRPRETACNQHVTCSTQYPSLAQLKQYHALMPLTATMGSLYTEPVVKVEEAENNQKVMISSDSSRMAIDNGAKALPRDSKQCVGSVDVKREAKREENDARRERESCVGSVPNCIAHVGGVVERDTPPTRPSQRLRLRSLRSVSHTSLSSGDLSGHESGTDDDFENEDSPRKRGRKKETSDDFNPNPERLLLINNQLRQLNKMMNDMTPVNEMPTHAKNKGRRERNKLASRACRLKKKATYEANKLKLRGLEKEQEILVTAISKMRQEIERRTSGDGPPQQHMGEVWNEVAKPAFDFRVAGRLNEYVNEMLESQAVLTYPSWESDTDSN